MTWRNVVWVIVYYLVVAFMVWVFWSDEPPLRTRYYYYLTKVAQRSAATLGRIGLNAEANYIQELERTR